MKIVLSIFFLTFSFLKSSWAAPLASHTVIYGTGKKFEGYVAEPKVIKNKLPAILVIHNWMGITEETKKQVNRLAELGYVVFAADIYGQGQRPKDTKEAGQWATKYKTDRKLFREHLNTALNELLAQKNADKSKIAAAGYCFGGTGVLELARSGADILGVISFHGGLDSPKPEDGKNIKAKVLALHGAVDPYVAEKDVSAFETEMKNYKIDYQLIKYGNTVHSFTEKAAGDDLSKGAAYNESSDVRSFAAAKNFLSEIF